MQTKDTGLKWTLPDGDILIAPAQPFGWVFFFGDPRRTRTGISALKGLRPDHLDEWTIWGAYPVAVPGRGFA